MTDSFLLYDGEVVLFKFQNKTMGLATLKMLANSRYDFLKRRNGTLFDNDTMELHIDELFFEANGLCTRQKSYYYNACTRTFIDIDNDTRTQEHNIDKNIEQLEQEFDSAIKKSELTQESDNLSVFCANKKTYNTIRNKICGGLLKEDNVPLMFSDKYMLFKFMDTKNLLKMNSNIEAKTEYQTFVQLYKIIEANDAENTCDPLNEIDEKFNDQCMEFLQYLHENGGVPEPENVFMRALNTTSNMCMFAASEDT